MISLLKKIFWIIFWVIRKAVGIGFALIVLTAFVALGYSLGFTEGWQSAIDSLLLDT